MFREELSTKSIAKQNLKIMKKNVIKKLKLQKQVISKLTDEESFQLKGGASRKTMFKCTERCPTMRINCLDL